jgi:glycosyltransferase involved in cell wall biosynthesis
MAEHRVLITVSGSIPDDLDPQVERGERPRADYRVLAERIGADVVDVDAALVATGRRGRWAHRIGGAGLLLAWHCFTRRKRYDVILTDGEQVGLPFAALTRLMGRAGTKHVMIVHILSVPKKSLLIRWGRLASQIDRFLVYATAQGDFVRDELGVPADRVELTTFMVDSSFFSSKGVAVERRRMICSAGLERRDYPTLMAAVDGLDVEVVIAAASPWSKQPDSSSQVPIPANVRIERLTLFELRDLYAASQFVVMPLVDVDFQAGITTILEAMSMERAVLCTRTTGQTDTIVDGVNGRYVTPADPGALRAAIEELLADPELTDWLGRNARTWVTEHADIEPYADRIARIIDAL